MARKRTRPLPPKTPDERSKFIRHCIQEEFDRKTRLRNDQAKFGLPSIIEFLEYLGFTQNDIKDLLNNQSVIGDWFTGKKSVNKSKQFTDLKKLLMVIREELHREIMPDNEDVTEEVYKKLNQLETILNWPLTIPENAFDELVQNEPEVDQFDYDDD